MKLFERIFLDDDSSVVTIVSSIPGFVIFVGLCMFMAHPISNVNILSNDLFNAINEYGFLIIIPLFASAVLFIHNLISFILVASVMLYSLIFDHK